MLYTRFITFVVSVVKHPSVSRHNNAPALVPHRTATAATAIFNGSDQAFEVLEYCCTTSPPGPPMAKNWPLYSHSTAEIGPEMSILWRTAALRRSQIETIVEPFAAVASHVPFSEKDMAAIGPVESKFAALVALLTSYTLI